MFGQRKKTVNRFVKEPAISRSGQTKKGKNIKTKTIKTRLIRLALILLAIALLWLIFMTNVFKIKQIRLSKTDNISGSILEKFIWKELGQKRLYVFSQNNLVFLDKNWLADSLYQKFQINQLRIKKKWPNTLVINLKEKEYALVWHEADVYYYINLQGDIILQSAERPQDLIIIDNLDKPMKQGRTIVVAGKYLEAIVGLDQQVRAAIKDLPIQQYILDGEVNTFKLKVEDGPLLYFNTEASIDKQVNKLKAVRKELRDEIGFNNRLYIDLRFGDRIFYQ